MPKSWYQIKAKAADQAEIAIFDEIGFWGVTAKDFIAELKSLPASEITLSINSPGGSVFDALAIYNALRGHGAQIKVRVMGVAASAASLIAMAGDTIVMPENTFMMIHNPIGGVYGNAEDMRDLAETLDKIGASLTATYVARTGQDEATIQALLDAETWLDAAQAVELGFADELEPALKIAASFDVSLVERLPEHIRAAFDAVAAAPDAKPAEAPAPVALAPTLAERIVAACQSAGLSDYAAEFALDARLVDDASIASAMQAANEVIQLCAIAGRPDQAKAFIRAARPVADVRAALLAARAEADEAAHTDNHIPMSTSKPPHSEPQAVSTQSIWAARNASANHRN